MDQLDAFPRIKKPWIETPLIESPSLSKTAGCRIFLKLELLQPSGSFKSRGIGNLILSSFLDPANRSKFVHFYISSGGNAGLAAVTAAKVVGRPCTVIVPTSTKPMMIQKLREAGAADVITVGKSWFEADKYLREKYIENQSEQSNPRNVYIPPFDHPEIWKGAGTMVDEIAEQLPPRDVEHETGCSFPADMIVCSVGGGGLFNGVVDGLQRYLQSHPSPTSNDALRKNVQILAVETEGADSLAHSLREGSLQSLPAITSLATSLGALCVAPQTFKNAQSPPAGIEVKNYVGLDSEAAQGVVRLAESLRLLVEPACGISVEATTLGRLENFMPDLTASSRVVVVVCGGNAITADMVADYTTRLNDGWV